MPAEIDHVDAIARRERRDVLYLEFHPPARAAQRSYSYPHDTVRDAVLAWLGQNGFAFQPCGGIANPNAIWPYYGQVALDIHYDDADPRYRVLRDHLEHADGSMRIDGVRFCVMPLSHAMMNAEHDEPGFWERWAEGF